MKDISDVLDSYLMGKLKADQWEAEFMSRFYKPIGDMVINRALENARNDPKTRKFMEKRLSPQAKRKFRGE